MIDWPDIPQSLSADFERWLARKEEAKNGRHNATMPAATVFPSIRDELLAAFNSLPDEPVGKRVKWSPQIEKVEAFRRVCPPEFFRPIDRSKLPNTEAFDAVANWKGTYPAPLASGDTGCGKTRASWVALGRLCTEHDKAFSWFSTKRLTERYFEYHMDGEPERFWRALSRFDILFVDDLDKLELNDRNATMAFEFADWVYREHRPVLVTTNRNRDWWVQRMGEAFVRRLFDESHFHVPF